MEDYVLEALRKGLSGLTFLEHLESGINPARQTWLSRQDFSNFYREGLELQLKYQDRIEIFLGIECGYNPERVDKLKQLLGSNQWQQRGLSCHFLKMPEESEHLNLFSKRPENIARLRKFHSADLFNRYFALLLEGIQELPVDKVCHLDGALRFLTGTTPHTSHREQIEKIFSEMAVRNIALEVNTSGIDYRGEVFPAAWILNLAQQYKLRLVAGSDAHKPEDVGRYFSRLSRLISTADNL